MRSFTIRDFRSRPRQAREALVREGEAVLTASGKPVAVLFCVDSGNLDETLEMVQRVKAQRSLRAIRLAARKRGLDRLRGPQIDAIIAKARKARHRSE